MYSQSVKLNSGYTMPVLGLGTWKADPGQVGEAVKAAISAGYRHIDCAAIYFNEEEVGEALQECFKSGIVKREDLFITTKLWNTFHLEEHVADACKASLKRLQLDYVDLYLVHYPVAFAYTGPLGSKGFSGIPMDESKGVPKFEKAPLHKTWAKMESLVDSKLTRSIGVSNYTIPVVMDLMSYCRIAPAVLQVEVHPYFQRQALRDFCKLYNIHVTAYSPLGSGRQGPMQDDKIKRIADGHKKSPAQVLVRWSIQQGNIVIPKSSNPERLKSNAEVFDFKLSDAEMKEIETLERQLVTCNTADYWNGFSFVAL